MSKHLFSLILSKKISVFLAWEVHRETCMVFLSSFEKNPSTEQNGSDNTL